MSVDRLSVERLFDDPPLFRALPSGFRFATDGSFVAFLRGAEDNRERLDLWRYDVGASSPRCWLNAEALGATGVGHSEAEKAERERKRQFTFGITSFALSPDGAFVLICADGVGYLLSIADETLQQVTPAQARQTDLRFSATGKQLSYVRDGNLYRYVIAQQREIAMTTETDERIQCGIADFIAAEEMHRFVGHWWSPDDTWLAYTRVDDTPIEPSRRFEIGADSFDVIEQRYPYAGETNARVELVAANLATGTTQVMEYRDHPEDYLARVNWLGARLAVQNQSRDQRTLCLKLVDPQTGECQRVVEEHSDTWVDLHDNFKALDPQQFVWTSERSGTSQIYLYEGDSCRALTQGPGRVNEILHADTSAILYLGWDDSPTEQHLFQLPLSANGVHQPQRLTEAAGWHEVAVAADGSQFVDRWNSLTDPGQIRLTEVTGQSQLLLQESIGPGHPYFPYLPEHTTSILGTLAATDGQDLHYRLTTPSTVTGRHPVIVSVYGGPGVQRVKNEWAPTLLQLFSQRGYGVLELDNRGSSNRDRAFQDPIHGKLGDVEVADQVRGAEFLATLPWVDAQRIGVFGHSYGGYMTLMCMSKAPETFAAGVAVAPVSDWRLYDTHYTERYLKTPAANADGYRASSVFPYLNNLRGPLLVIHGMADDNVLFTHSTKLFAALQQANQHFEMMTYPGSKHALQEREVSVHRFNLILDFFDRSLQSAD